MRRFLYEWANAGDLKALGRLAKRYPEFHVDTMPSPPGLPRSWQTSLRTAWREPDLRWKTWLLAKLLVKPTDIASTSRPGNWAENIGHAVIDAIRIADRLVVCSNPECSAPLFIRQRKNQAQCSLDCANWAQRQWKRQWWRAHGKAWKEAKKQSQKLRRKLTA
jgi:hypothetical protein